MSSAMPDTPMTAAQYLAWEAAQHERHEFFRGEVFAMAGGSPRHNALTAAVIVELGIALRGGPCRVLSADQRIGMRQGEHYVYADASVVCGALQIQAGTTDVLVNPAVIVEVLSKRTEAYDRGSKWDGYQRLASVQDYLLVSQTSAQIEHYRRESSGGWHYTIVEAGGRLLLSNGTQIELDGVYAGVFALDGE
jgi:Uma2 family endonuclease